MGDQCRFGAERGRCERMLIFLLTNTRDSSHLCYDGNDARQRRLPKWMSFIELIRASLKRKEVNIMDRFQSVKNPINIAPSLPNRRGKRPLTIVSPLHVQCSDHGDDKALRDLVNEVIAWPDIEAGPLPVGSADLISFQVGEDVATGDPSVFIAGREFGRVLFGAPTIYLTLPLICAHWAVVRGWAEPHYSSGTRLGTARCNGCLHATRRRRGGSLSIAVLDFLQFFLEPEEQEVRGMEARLEIRAQIASGTLHAQARSMKTPLPTVRLLF